MLNQYNLNQRPNNRRIFSNDKNRMFPDIKVFYFFPAAINHHSKAICNYHACCGDKSENGSILLLIGKFILLKPR